MSKLVWRVAFCVMLVGAFLAFQPTIKDQLATLSSDPNVDQDVSASATSVYRLVALVAGALCVIVVLRALLRLSSAQRDIQRFEGPYLDLMATEERRHRQAVADWDAAARRHQAAVDEAQRQWASGPRWFPVQPVAEPMRIDVVGGDADRHGWASLLVTLGTSVLSRQQPITLLDLTGQDVGGGLVEVARANGIATRRVELPGDGLDTVLLDGLDAAEIADGVAHAVGSDTASADSGSASSELRQERAFTAELVRKVVGCLDGAVGFGRIAAGIDVLRQVTPPGGLAPGEQVRLAELVGELGHDEWTGRQMRFVASQLRVLGEAAQLEGLPSDATRTEWVWAPAPVRVVATAGGRSDRKDVLDRLVVHLAQLALRPGAGTGPAPRRAVGIGGWLMVAGADRLGAETLETLSDHARSARVRLVLLIERPHGDLESVLGTGGAVCVMKMYNHRDAAAAADFVGRGYKFVVSQVSYQVGKTFTDGGGDSFGATTSEGTSSGPGSGQKGRGLTDNRSHAWTGTRSWSVGDNVSDSRTLSRVHELTVDPEQILGLPETAFVLVDNAGPGRRVTLADCNPGICLLDRIAPA
jgi:hypothetical protein